jgi:hypothetical protein
MVLHLNLPPELEQYLLQEATQQGVSVETMTVELLTRLMQLKQDDQGDERGNAERGNGEMETRYLMSIPGMVESLHAAASEPIETCTKLEDLDW